MSVVDHDSTIDAETAATNSWVESTRIAQDKLLPTLTIAFHPDVSRVGHQAVVQSLLDGKPVGISRHEPIFADSGGSQAEPLRHRFVSRQPVTIRLAGDSLVVSPAAGRKVLINGDWATTETRLPVELLQLGIVLQLVGGVTLILKNQRRGGPANYGLVGVSDGIADVRRQIEQVGPLPHTVLIRGESGTGKELVASALHAVSPRAQREFIAVNMAALNKGTAAAQLFGHVRGAFTGANKEGKGYFREAEGGTLFLDEIGTTEDAVQGMLLRALENREIQPVGDTKVHPVDVRLIAATDADLEQMKEHRQFNSALYNRLAAYELMLPALRERREDVGLLFFSFLRQELESMGAAHKLDDTGGERNWFSTRWMPKLLEYPWPGNVRELRNAAANMAVNSAQSERAAFAPSWERILDGTAGADGLTGSGRYSTAPPVTVQSPLPPQSSPPAPGRSGISRSASERLRPSELSDDTLLRVMSEHRWVVEAAAKSLGISKTSLYELVKKHPDIPQASDLSEQQVSRALEENQNRTERAAQQLKVSPRALQRRIKELGL